MDKTRSYTQEEILALALTIELNDKSVNSFKWLMEHNCVELAALCDVLVNGKAPARDWLEKNNYTTITTFIDAISPDDNDNAIQALLHSTHPEWAAVANMVNDGDDDAEQWLIKNGLKYFAAFGDILDKKLEESNTRVETATAGVLVAEVVVGALLGGFGGMRFGAMGGGGSFGGAGAGGLW
ncbi:MAG TPA: hypothetical protein VK809_05035 [Bacteroidia bacterium]|nr:hypothetical protein [Bacteroidia bacterium]